MKKKIYKILGVALTLVMVLSLTIVFSAPVAATEYPENEWGTWGLPAVEPETNVGPMAVAPDGTIYAAVHYYDEDEDDYFWKVMKSEDDGYTWDDTDLTDLESDSDGWENGIVSVVVSPNYEEDETVYVGTFVPPLVYRLEEAGDDVTALKPIYSTIDAEYAEVLFCIDIYTDEDDANWILAGTELDALVLRDKSFEDWRDQELSAIYSDDDIVPAFEVAFAPDFDESNLIWAVIDYDGDFLVTSTESPGNWGQEVDEAVLIDAAGDSISPTPFLDIDFAEDYASDLVDTVVFVGFSSWGDGNVNMVLGVEGDGSTATADSEAIALMEDDADITSIAVSSDWEEAVILAGELWDPVVWFSDDGGTTWDEADKQPTGEGWTHVYMDKDVVWDGAVFDPEENMSFVSTFGDESAISRSDPNEDGDLVYNQVGLTDTEIEVILDLAFSPDYPDEPTFLTLTYYSEYGEEGTTSLWLTENGDEEEPDYMRVLCADGEEVWDDDIEEYIWVSAPGNFAAYLGPYYYDDDDDIIWSGLVEFAQDGEAIYLHGWDYDTDNSSIWKSTDGGQTFGSRRSVKSVGDEAAILDWVITDSSTIYAAVYCFNEPTLGFFKTTRSGLTWTAVDTEVDEDGGMNSIALQPGFDAEDEDMSWIALGGWGGEVLLSSDAGDGFDDTELTDVEGRVFVAFDADFADEDADGYMLIYAAGEGDIMVGEVADTDDVAWDPLEDDTNEAAQDIYATGLKVAPDNALYAVAVEEVEDDGEFIGLLFRLLLDEDDSIWESAEDDDLGAPWRFWLTPGSNVLWTIDLPVWDEEDEGELVEEAELWVLEDLVSGQVTLDSPADEAALERQTIATLEWEELDDADEYDYEYTNTWTLETESDTIDDTWIGITGLSASYTYEWRVRVSPGEPFSSRWSDEWTFSTAMGEAEWNPFKGPVNEYPWMGATDVPLAPTFAWNVADWATGYEFVLADNDAFSDPILDTELTTTVYQYDAELDYFTTYYWKVRAVSATGTSNWATGVFTTMEKPIEIVAPPPPVEIPPLPAPITPAWIWAIVIIGAILVIAVIILIVLTRRVP